MDLNRILALLVQERVLLDRAIASLERLAEKLDRGDPALPPRRPLPATSRARLRRRRG